MCHCLRLIFVADREQTEEEMDFEEPPPIYEPPPSYDEIIKVGMDDQMLQSP